MDQHPKKRRQVSLLSFFKPTTTTTTTPIHPSPQPFKKHKPLDSPISIVISDSDDVDVIHPKPSHINIAKPLIHRPTSSQAPPLPSVSNPSTPSIINSQLSSSTKPQKVQTGHTPLELQVILFKETHPDILLAIEVGYKYRFFGNDAIIAGDLLGIATWQDKHFMTAYVPTHRIHFHIRTLVNAGLKVGLVQQTETAALKSVGSNPKKSSLFERKLTRVYTKATLIDEVDDDNDNHSALSDSLCSSFIVSISTAVQTTTSGSRASPCIQIAMTAIDPTSLDMIVDVWVEPANGFLSELDARLETLSPLEIVLVDQVYPKVQVWIDQLIQYKPQRIRLESIDACGQDSTANSLLDSLAARIKNNPDLLQKVQTLDPLLQKTILGSFKYLEQYQLDDLPLVLSQYTTACTFRMSASALRSLSVLNEDPSLFSILNNKISTSAGSRQLRQWLAKPLVYKDQILARSQAIDFLISIDMPTLDSIQKSIRRIGTGTRVLAKIQLCRVKPSVLWHFCLSWVGLCDLLCAFMDDQVVHTPVPMLIMRIVNSVTSTKPLVSDFLLRMDQTAAVQNDYTNVWASSTTLSELRSSLDNINASIAQTAQEAAESVHQGCVTKVASGDAYLIQVSKTTQVPGSWTRVSATKLVVRYTTPQIQTLMKSRDIVQETLTQQSKSMFAMQIQEFGAESFGPLTRAINSLAELDCLLALADIGRNPSYCKPTFSDSQVIEIEEGRHPILDSMIHYVPISVSLLQTGYRCLVLTGPNMAGKSSVVRLVALIIILAQIGARVPAKSVTLGVFDGIYTRMGASDDFTKGSSTFLVEMQETEQCLLQATSRSLVILDELGRGTSTCDGQAVAYAVLDHMVNQCQCMTLFVTHFPAVESGTHVLYAHMSYVQHDNRKLTFMYQLVLHAVSQSFGIHVAQLAGVPHSILAVADHVSRNVACHGSGLDSDLVALVKEFQMFWHAV